MKIWNKTVVVIKAVYRVCLELAVFPFRKNRTDFVNQLKNANRILIACPLNSMDYSSEKAVLQIAQLFPSEGTVILHPDPKQIVNKTLVPWTMEYSDNNSLHFWHLITSRTHQKIEKEPFDIFIDLNPKSHLYFYYLCCLLSPALRISFPKTCGSKFYNFIFRTDPEIPYSKKLSNLFRFLKSLRQIKQV